MEGRVGVRRRHRLSGLLGPAGALTDSTPPSCARPIRVGRARVTSILSLVLFAVAVFAIWRGLRGVGGPASVSTPADSAAGEVTFRFVEPGHTGIVVHAIINGRDTVDLLLDTGSTSTCIDDSLARHLSLTGTPGSVAVGVGIGGAGIARLVTIDSLRVGPTVARGLPTCTINLAQLRRIDPGVRGLLGLNFMRSFRLTIDFDRRVVRFAPRRVASSAINR